MNKYNFDYTSIMLMKMFLARPKDGESEVLINFEQALEIIKRTDSITQNIKKIIYLVGWQYNGHDDKYPDIYKVNRSLLRSEDNSAYDSLLWLISEAKKYNTVVSLHINFADAYEDAEMFDELVKANALIRDSSGKAVAVETYNGKACYKVSYKEYWESGLFQKHFTRFINFLPVIKEQKTIHVDNFQCYYNFNPDIDVFEMQIYRNKMIDYVSSYGVDITSEGVYRECEAGKDNYNCKVPKDVMQKQTVATLGRIPAVWWLSPYGDNDFINIPLNTLCGGIPGDEYYDVFYGNTHGEDVWLEHGAENGSWEKYFIEKFACELVPYRLLAQKKCTEIATDNEGYKTAYFDDETVSCGKNAKVYKNDNVYKIGSDISMPVVFMKNTFLFYSKNETTLCCNAECNSGIFELYKITPNGNQKIGTSAAENGILTVKTIPDEAILAIKSK